MKQFRWLDTGAKMRVRLVIIALAVIVFSIAPVSAQAGTGASDITPAGLLVAGAAIIVAIIGGVFALLAKYVDNRLADAKVERDDDSAKVQNLTRLIEVLSTLVKSISDQATATAKDRADANSDRAKLLDIVETKTTAKEGREQGIEAINKHTEAVVEPVQKVIESAAQDIRAAVVSVPTMEQFSDELARQLDPILDQLTQFGVHFAAMVKNDLTKFASNPAAPSPSLPVSVVNAVNGTSASASGDKIQSAEKQGE